jgi:hypothetical protein
VGEMPAILMHYDLTGHSSPHHLYGQCFVFYCLQLFFLLERYPNNIYGILGILAAYFEIAVRGW